MTDQYTPWACDDCGRAPPAVSFPVLVEGTDTDEWLCRECRADRRRREVRP